MSQPPSTLAIEELTAFAESLARAAGAVTLRHFGTGVEPEEKEDGTPVTVADREAETLLRERIREQYPEHGILGEEFGEDRPEASVRWILDPIDGTKSFVHGVPLYGVLIGVEIEGEPAVGVAHLPALQETVSAGVGIGCHWNGVRAAVSRVEQLEDAVALITDVESAEAQGIGEGWRGLADKVAFARTWGDCYGHVLVATGRAEIMVDPILSAWDASPFLPILTEAGGHFTDLDGIPTIHGGSAVASNGILHGDALGLLRSGS
jgi:histidinol phosphatase-like enzyme (inositol monophosphatase family)